MMNIEKESQAAQYEFFARGDAAFAEWESIEHRDKWIDRVQRWKIAADKNGGVFPDGSCVAVPDSDKTTITVTKGNISYTVTLKKFRNDGYDVESNYTEVVEQGLMSAHAIGGLVAEIMENMQTPPVEFRSVKFVFLSYNGVRIFVRDLGMCGKDIAIPINQIQAYCDIHGANQLKDMASGDIIEITATSSMFNKLLEEFSDAK